MGSGGMSCIFGMFKNKASTTMLPRKLKMEKEERVKLCIFICCEAVGNPRDDDPESSRL